MTEWHRMAYGRMTGEERDAVDSLSTEPMRLMAIELWVASRGRRQASYDDSWKTTPRRETVALDVDGRRVE